jgi:hypothetical protein
MDSTFFNSRIGTNFRDMTAAMLQRGYSADDFSTLAAAINQAESDTAMVIVAENHKALTATDTLRKKASLAVYKGGLINISSGVNFLIQGHFYAGRYKVFEGSGTVTFGEGSVDEIFPEWWGAVSDSSTASLTALNSTVSRTPAQARIDLADGVYLISDSLNLSSSVTKGKSIRGNPTARTTNATTAPDGSVIKSTNTSGKNAVILNSNGSEISDLSISGTGTNGIGLYVYRPTHNTTMGDYLISNIHLSGHGSDGLRVDGADGTLYQKISSQWNLGYGINFDVPTGVGNPAKGILPVLFTGRTRGNKLGGIRMEQDHPLIMNFEAIADTVGGIFITGSSAEAFRNQGTLFINNDVEFAIPSRTSPSTPVFNYKLQDTRNTVYLGGYAGSIHSKNGTADAGTTTTTVVDADLAISTTNYYVNWKFVNNTRSSGEINVTAYNGSTKTLTLASSVASQTTGDSYTIKKYPNRGIWADSVYSATFINTAWANQDSPIVVQNTFGNFLFLGDQSNLNPNTDIYRTGSGTANWGELAINKSTTNGELWLHTNRELEIKAINTATGPDARIYIDADSIITIQPSAEAGIRMFQDAADGEAQDLRLYGDVNTSGGSLNSQYISIDASSSANNQFNIGTSVDAVRVGFTAATVMTGNDSVDRYIEFVASSNPGTPATNRIKLFGKSDDKLYSRDDAGNVLNLTPFIGSATWNPADLAAGATDSTDVTVSNASVGDVVVVGFSSITSSTGAKFSLYGHVISSGSVRVYD